MSGRGRGGRGGARGGVAKSMSKEQLTALGATATDFAPGPVTQPPPLYPLLERKPVPLTSTAELDYVLLLRQGLMEHMQLSPAYLKMPINRDKEPEQAIERLVAQLPMAKEKFDWKLYPTELRPKLSSKRIRRKVVKEVNVNERLQQLEKLEEVNDDEVKVKTEVEDEEEEEQADAQEYEDEEMDDGTDYANNYFDNGEAYEDEDDNLDDGPIY